MVNFFIIFMTFIILSLLMWINVSALIVSELSTTDKVYDYVDENMEYSEYSVLGQDSEDEDAETDSVQLEARKMLDGIFLAIRRELSKEISALLIKQLEKQTDNSQRLQKQRLIGQQLQNSLLQSQLAQSHFIHNQRVQLHNLRNQLVQSEIRFNEQVETQRLQNELLESQLIQLRIKEEQQSPDKDKN